MTDIVDRKTRSRMMAAIRGRDTKPERIVRSYLHGRGLRFRIHRKDLPGTPDIVLPKHRVVVFVHGCFWHRHHGCPLAYVPATRTAFWLRKFKENVDRDRRNRRELQRLGWQVLTVWECELDTKRLRRLAQSIAKET